MYILIFAWLWPRAVKVVSLNLLLTTPIKLIVSADKTLRREFAHKNRDCIDRQLDRQKIDKP